MLAQAQNLLVKLGEVYTSNFLTKTTYKTRNCVKLVPQNFLTEFFLITYTGQCTASLLVNCSCFQALL